MASITSTLDRKLDPEARATVLQALFNQAFSPRDLACFESCFAFYERELLTLGLGKWLETRPATSVIVQSHAELLQVIGVSRAGGSSSKEHLRNELKGLYPATDDRSLDAVIDLSLRLSFMVNVRAHHLRLQTPQTPVIVWNDHLTVNELLARLFPPSRWELGVKDSRLHPSFTAVFMVDICGLQLQWTDCLADHLRLDRREKALHIFAHKAFLQHHLLAQDTGKFHCGGFPSIVLNETILTLNLLFPQWDAKTNVLLQTYNKDFQHRGPYDAPKSLNFMEFDHWRDRLMEVYDVVFLAPPVSWAQLWRDRRNPQQFWTFWIALLILFLTLISTVATLIQAWASVHSTSFD